MRMARLDAIPITHLKFAISLVALFAITFAACTRDPEVRKQRFFESGNEYAKQGRSKEAVIEYRNAIQIDPRFAQARVKLAETYVKIGDAAGALNEYVRAADLLPEDVDVQIAAGRYLLAAGRPEEALSRADAALAR